MPIKAHNKDRETSRHGACAGDTLHLIFMLLSFARIKQELLGRLQSKNCGRHRGKVRGQALRWDACTPSGGPS
ncbi:hypothetical protein ANANG_G00264530 [Anguilla anguilla]|uniref:Uncharacterized protein n=1 Tax=Anguilla anguilla TaxID=7936 RepID=A0A9D3LT76_ANGAN|nr:hypothetical protein ANANG_G00264530 [Anguilla anguilla]